MIPALPLLFARGVSMQKAFSVAVLLLAVFAFTSASNSAGSSAGLTSTSPAIVAQGKLINQTEPFSATIFTPAKNGVFRLSVYATLTTAASNSQSFWHYAASWTDATGQVQTSASILTTGNDNTVSAFYSALGLGGATMTIQANAGTPITLFTYLSCPGSSCADGSAYSAYYVLESLQ
jgi:hypothetical protein